jgi:hypothetical protein
LWLLAIGFLFTAVNAEVGGVGIVLPTFVGFALIAVGSWRVSERVPRFGLVAFPAAAMSLLTFPLLVRGVADLDSYAALLPVPEFFLGLAIAVSMSAALWSLGAKQGVWWPRIAGVLTLPIFFGSLAWCWSLNRFVSTRDWCVLVYEIPDLYLACVTAFAAVRLGRRAPGTWIGDESAARQASGGLGPPPY